MDKQEANKIIQDIATECGSHSVCENCQFCLAPFDGEDECCIFDNFIIPKELKNYEL